MSREGPMKPSRTRGADAEGAYRGTSSMGGPATLSTETVFRGDRDLTAPVGEECTVRVDGEPLDCRYDLLSASPSGFEWGYGGSGPAQLSVALLAHAYGASFASENYQQFKREVITHLPEDEWTLTKQDLDEWREVNIE